MFEPMIDPKSFLMDLFDVAVSAADPDKIIKQYLPERPKGRLVIIGAGKASARMAECVEAHYGPCDGMVITRYGHERPTQKVNVFQAGHPLPDDASVRATQKIIDLANSLGKDDLVIALISGGASALLCAPVVGLTLKDKVELTQQLLSSGAPISQINAIRKYLSAVKGGKLASTIAPAKILNLIISDVPGDAPEIIASGPTVPSKHQLPDLEEMANRWGIKIPREILSLASSQDNTKTQSLDITTYVIATPENSLKEAALNAKSCAVKILGDAIEGEARDVARKHVEIALQEQKRLGVSDKPVLLLSGGECTVTRRGDGIGGPNAEYVLAATIALNAAPGIHVLSCDTDGVDGAAEVAGAYSGPDTLERARRHGIDPVEMLSINDSHSFFENLGDQIITGPTYTNVNDFRAILIYPLTATGDRH